jgi:transposase
MPNIVKLRRSHTAHFKAQVVVAGMTKQLSINQLCKRNGISVSLYYIWKQRFISAGTIGLERQNRHVPKLVPSRNTVELQDTELARLEAIFLNTRKALMTFSRQTSEEEKLLVLKLVGSAKTSKRAALKRIGIPRSTYYRWVNTLRKTGTLQSCVRKSDYCSITERDDIKKTVFQVMHGPPSDFGFNRTTWKLDELQEAIAKSGIQVGRHSIRRIVKDAGYRWLKAREVLTSNDPEYRQKLSDIKKS